MNFNYRKTSFAVAAIVMSGSPQSSSAAQVQNSFDVEARSPIGVRVAQDTSAEKSAFESARELGTIAGWTAFLGSYPNGFYADLAKAYIQKLSDRAAAPQPTGPSTVQSTEVQVLPATSTTGGTHEIGCASKSSVTSRTSETPAKVTFSNRSGMDRAIQWIGFKGEIKTFANLGPGQLVTIDTFVSHPWIVTDGPGNCLHVIMPAAGPTQVNLGLAEPYVTAKVTPEPRRDEDEPKRKAKPEKTSRKITCPRGQTWNGSRCVDNPYVDRTGRPNPGYYSDSAGNIYQNNGGGE